MIVDFTISAAEGRLKEKGVWQRVDRFFSDPINIARALLYAEKNCSRSEYEIIVNYLRRYKTFSLWGLEPLPAIFDRSS